MRHPRRDSRYDTRTTDSDLTRNPQTGHGAARGSGSEQHPQGRTREDSEDNAMRRRGQEVKTYQTEKATKQTSSRKIVIPFAPWFRLALLNELYRWPPAVALLQLMQAVVKFSDLFKRLRLDPQGTGGEPECM